ncbi:MAG: reductive dehalogenase [Betaproteobacteria bacterium]
MRLFSYKNRPVHLGPFPLERLKRRPAPPDLSHVPPMRPLSFVDAARPESLVNAMTRYMGMLDAVREGKASALKAEIPEDPQERAHHLKAAGYYFDASMVGVCRLSDEAFLKESIRNPALDGLAEELGRGQPKSFAAGVDLIYADTLDAARARPTPARHHRYALVFLVEYTRDPWPGEPGTDWIHGTQAHRAAVLSALPAVLLSTYVRMLGWEARAHSASSSDVDLNKLAVAAGLADVSLDNPFVGKRYGLAAVTTTLELAPDAPLAEQRTRFHKEPYAARELRMGAYPFEKLKRVEEPTTFIDHARVPRFPKRADFFARALFGDMGKNVQEAAKGGMYVMKSPIGACARRALGALLLLQFGEARGPVSPAVGDPEKNSDLVKATSYYLCCDAVGLCAVPPWAYYSHDAGGNPLEPYHKSSVTMLYDQGHETMEGASGDDWISVAQSMRAYLRFSLLGGILAEQIRRLGYSARVHSVLDGDVLQPPLLLLSGLGEVSRIGEVILNPYLGPRLKSGAVTTDLPMAYDRPIDFGMQRFCESCNKCARECPSGAITAGPKLMYNGYEIWKSDAEKCARYRLTNSGGGMCGRCMKTCPWNLEGIFADSLFRWAAMNVPAAAPFLAKLDDKLGRGAINPVKKWWWDIEADPKTMQYVRAKQVHRRGLNLHLDLKYEDQTLAVYPADTMPPPYPVVFPLNREKGIERYKSLLTPQAYTEKLRTGETGNLVPAFRMPEGPPPVFPVILRRREERAADIARYEFVAPDGRELPPFEPGAHVDVVIAPEYLREYSLAGDPADQSRYVLGVQREAKSRGGSALMHRAFREGRRVFISRPRNNFPLVESAARTLLYGGGIGITPLLTMAHRLRALGRSYELHYSVRRRADGAFRSEVQGLSGTMHVSAEGTRLEVDKAIPRFEAGFHLYTCGSALYMDAIFTAAQAKGWPEEALHKEYFSVPEPPDYVNFAFSLNLERSRKTVEVPPEISAIEALARAGILVDTKCSDGICGVCATPYLSGEIEHRDHVLSAKERQAKMIVCCSRAKAQGGEIVLDL